MSIKISNIKACLEGAVDSAIESNNNILPVFKEVVENPSQHGAKMIEVVVTGTYKYRGEKETDTKVLIKSIKITDDGDGMSHAIFMSKFKNLYNRNMEANSTSRNGVGVKTTLQYFDKILINTTTNGLIEHTNTYCETEEDFKEIVETHNKASSLKVGDEDKERRYYEISRNSCSIDKFVPVNALEHGTEITLVSPKSEVIVSIDALIRILKHQIVYLKNGGQFQLTFPNKGQGKYSTKTIVISEGFDKQIIPSKKIAQIIGNNKTELRVINWNDSNTESSVTIIPKKDLPKKGIHSIDLTLYQDSEYTGVNIYDMKTQVKIHDYVEMISGSTIGDNFKFGSDISDRVLQNAAASQIHSPQSIMSKMRGFIITTDNVELKKSLRNNRQSLHEQNADVKIYNKMVLGIYKKFATFHTEWQKRTEVHQYDAIETDLTEHLNNVLSRIHNPNGIIHRNSSSNNSQICEINNEMWSCLTCEKNFKKPIGSEKIICPHCQSENVERYKTPKFNKFTIKLYNQPLENSYKIVTFEQTGEGGLFKVWKLHPELHRLQLVSNPRGKAKKMKNIDSSFKNKIETEAQCLYSMYTVPNVTFEQIDNYQKNNVEQNKRSFFDGSRYPTPIKQKIMKDCKKENIDLDILLK